MTERGARFELEGRVVVVTGALGRLGSNFVCALADAGAKVVALDLPTACDNPPSRFSSIPTDQLMLAPCDVTSRVDIESVLEKVQTRWGTPFGLINNAAIDAPPDADAGENGPFESYPEKSFDRMMEVNTKGPFLCCQVFGGAMATQGGGSIVNIGSIYGVLSPDQSLYEYRRERGEVFYKPVAYSVSKSALYNMTRYLAAYWGSKSVRVNILTLAGVFANQDTEFLKRYVSKVPLGRMANEDEYSGAAVFLVSDASSYMTGSNLVLDGGFTAI